MAVYHRRPGDVRPLVSTNKERLAWHPSMPIRWLPRHGQPGCFVEWTSQQIIRWSAYLPVYTALVVTLTLVVLLWWHR
jgi:hypothetical protein